ncbi:hypothetical protein EF847_15665 [Actinobacteria bacterium YIM 96077]|uniref:Uncharacterized protein n=1 Tax=Phytoactinopolyspora halophila TaxID=1981511 RepID=A0A329QEB3_9ACTN|nr:hypothetical protein [Phytoactinopolyspora halophila]AYY13920.1 hypothetical protein EF847_15665 [Actinobacteria bacterium YIM 96077]RAW10049.1 hypothetical protein DPM12_19485 [Phytoactinopolyspora halophila]
MSDEGGSIEFPDGRRFSEADLVQEIRRSLLGPAQDAESATTDEYGNPLPQLNLDERPRETDDALSRIGYALLAQLPERWETAILEMAVAADDVRATAIVKVQDSDDASYAVRFFFPDVEPDLAAACVELRRSMYEPHGHGAWYNIQIKLNRDGTIVPSYDFSNPPFVLWGPNEVDLVRRDHELYPRDPELLPAWHPSRA